MVQHPACVAPGRTEESPRGRTGLAGFSERTRFYCRWDGDTLVVETTNFSPNSYYRGATDGLHLVERFTRTGPDTLAYRVTLTDPQTWASSWTAEVPLQHRDQPIYEFACHEGNKSIVGMLRTARLEDVNR